MPDRHGLPLGCLLSQQLPASSKIKHLARLRENAMTQCSTRGGVLSYKRFWG
jgi:hypothetical protein